MKQNKTERQARIDEIRSMHMRNSSDNDWFFDQFDKGTKKAARNIGLVWLGMVLLNLLFWGALIAFGAWAIGHWVV